MFGLLSSTVNQALLQSIHWYRLRICCNLLLAVSWRWNYRRQGLLFQMKKDEWILLRSQRPHTTRSHAVASCLCFSRDKGDFGRPGARRHLEQITNVEVDANPLYEAKDTKEASCKMRHLEQLV
ncbi:hypothetical protein AAFF_G00003440 [Aldrovandia affinis]|uniref:Uncharacterized protein n=1 Tax=Aldrovandia affinis TaxID=143900 RepID=A0AAD7X3J4_9TELE|nr:hypothetical protein AAFF_G00003440 [Aldrovandia affinis]